MEALDLRLRDQQFQNSLVVTHGLHLGQEQQFANIVLGLGFEYTTRSKPIYYQGSCRQRYDITQCVTDLMEQKCLTDVIGSRSLDRESFLFYTTLVSEKPKPYFSVYVELLRQINMVTGMPMVVWLEDLISLPRFNWSLEAIQKATVSTRDWFASLDVKIVIGISSEHEGGIVPLDFIRTRFSNYSVSEFTTMLPFHKHDMSLVSVSDVAHCVWSMYVYSCFPGLHFTATNSKRNYQLFRKLCGKRYSVALITPVSE